MGGFPGMGMPGMGGFPVGCPVWAAPSAEHDEDEAALPAERNAKKAQRKRERDARKKGRK